MVKKTKIVIDKHPNTVSPHYSAVYFTFIHDNYSIQLVRNGETRWNYKTGFKIRNRELTIGTLMFQRHERKNRQELKKFR